ncbi:MAG TPA: transketolase [Pseudomonadales bacterium]|nr:transketolase [Pseudomonadales bacterium]
MSTPTRANGQLSGSRRKIDVAEANRARKRLLQMHYESGVGHIGGNLSALDAMLLLHHEFLTDNDHFVLSKGHSAGALYIALWSAGKLHDEQLKTFHRDNTLLAGHPPSNGLPGVMFATGSLGHGLSLAAGTALATKLRHTNQKVYCLTSDGEWQEGSMWEALIFATHHNLDNLTIAVDHNELQGFGSTNDIASMGKLWEKLNGFNAEIIRVDGHNLMAIREAFSKPCNRVKVVILHTIKGKGVSFMENKMEWHYLPLTESLYKQADTEFEP